MKKKRLVALWFAVLLSLSACGTPADTQQVSAPQEPSVQTSQPVAAPVEEPQKSNTYSDKLEIDFIDVGQADSILITNKGEAMLVDAGTNEAGTTVLAELENKGVSTLKYAVGTHPHEDHIGGLDDVINTLDVQNVLLPTVTNTTKTYASVLDAIEAKKVPTETPKAGNVYKIGDATATVLSCLDTDDLNNSSIVLKVQYGNTSVLLQGDAEAEAEQAILDSGANIDCDIIKLGHHGSNTSTSQAYLDAADPSCIAIISCGKDNSYGHPHQETLDKLSAAKLDVFRTDELGTIEVTSDGTNYTVSASGIDPITHVAGDKIARAKRQAAKEAAEKAAAEKAAAEKAAAEKAAADAAAKQKAQEEAAAQASQETKSQTVYVTKTGEKYHRDGCQYLRKSKIAISLDDAKAQGYTACSRCW